MRHFHESLKTLGWLVVALGLSTGCSRDPVTIPVEGRVTYLNQPLAGATVVFINTQNQTKASFAITGDDGRYRLHSFVPPDRELNGAWAANCKVLISKRERRNTSAALMQMARAAMGRLPGEPEDTAGSTTASPDASPTAQPAPAEAEASSAAPAGGPAGAVGGYPPGWEEAFGPTALSAPAGGVPIDTAARQDFIERMSAQNNGKSLIPAYYGDWQRTPLQATVESNGSAPLVFDFDLRDGESQAN